METQKTENDKHRAAAGPKPALPSFRKKKGDALFLQDVKDHIDEFINASMDEHKSCFQNTIQKMFGMSKIVAERKAEAKAVESSLPIQTTLAD